jgi:1-deoxy-D-xylulose-5-phosphate reductoisomerase
MRRVKSVAVLGATGSIGVQALEIVRDHPELSACALAAHSNAEALVASATAHGVDRIALVDPAAAARARTIFDGTVLEGEAGVVELVRDAGADTVLNAIVGAAGLAATLATFEAGADLALANKESLVAGGPLVTAAAERANRTILPVDSEHSALWQCLDDARAVTVESLVVTASGGPFRGLSAAELAAVTPDQALVHPTWTMGAKITIDSATLMNKGLEVIEAHHLFGTAYERIDVVVHPQSIIHSLIQLCDGATLAHLGYPDMRVPISYALHHPDRVDVPVRPLDLVEVGSLTFEAVDEETFGCLRLARESGIAGGTAPCTLNAANEVAVNAFLAGRLAFLDIAAVIEETLSTLPAGRVHSFESLGEADARARQVASELVAERAAA